MQTELDIVELEEKQTHVMHLMKRAAKILGLHMEDIDTDDDDEFGF